MTLIEKNLENLKIKIAQLAKQFERNPNEISLVAVSKFHPAKSIEEAYHCGIRDFGENYIQEWQKKSMQLSHLKDIRWHIIGNLQKNKVKFLNENVHLIQSVDSLELAKEIEKKWAYEKPLNTLVQLQLDATDVRKSGISLGKSRELCEFISQSHKLNLQGFMGIGPDIPDNEKLKSLYIKFVANSNNLWNFYPHNEFKKPILSLGMSQDLEIALECGSNMLRVGTAIFGLRP